MLNKTIIVIATIVLLNGCAADAPAPAPGAAVAEPPAEAADDRPVVVAFGDSLSEGYGVEPGLSYPEFLQKELDAAGYSYRVVNAGVSGDTTSGGRTRAASIAAMKPALVVLELGGNDGLRGLPIETTRANLDEIIVTLMESGTKVVLAGMTLPPNYGPDYIGAFEQVFTDLAEKHSLPLIPFLLEGVGGNKELMQADGIHATAEGNRIVAGTVMKVIAPLLEK